MKRLILGSAVLAFAIAASGCGSSSSTPTPSSITGTISGAAYTSAAELSVVASGNACTISSLAPVPVGVSMAVIEVTDVTATCTSLGSCLANSRNLTLVVARAKVGNLTDPSTNAPGFATGSYQYLNLADMSSFIPEMDANGRLSIFTGVVSAENATCSTQTPYGIASGTLTVTSVSGNTITGTVSVNLVNGLGQSAGSLSGTFSTTTNCTPSPAPSACDLLGSIIPT